MYFDTSPYFLPEKLFHTSANDVQQLIRNRLLAALVVLLRQILNQLIGIVRGSLHGKHTCRVLGSVRIQQDRINLLAQHFRKKLGHQLGSRGFYNVIIVETAFPTVPVASSATLPKSMGR